MTKDLLTTHAYHWGRGHDFLIIGLLNAYAMEDPITLIEGAGYTDLVERYVGADAYSYVLFGQAGYLGHALANSALAPQVTGVTIWHINADEPRALDYNEEYNSAGQLDSLYSEDAYRSSDHGPVIVGLELGLPHRAYLPLASCGTVPAAVHCCDPSDRATTAAGATCR